MSKVGLKTEIGGLNGANPLRLSVPVIIAPISYGALSASTKRAVGLASTLSGIATQDPEHEKRYDPEAELHNIHRFLEGCAGRSRCSPMTGGHAMNALRCLLLPAWMTLVLVTTLCAPVPTAAQSSPSSSVEEAEASVGLDRAQRKRIQLGLRALGFNPGAADGLFGPRTRKAIGQWQSSRGEPSTGYLDANSATTLLEAGKTAAATPMDLIAEALSVARSITDAETRAGALLTIARAQTETGNLVGAARSVAEALNTVRSIGDASSRAQKLGSIAQAQARAGDIAEALSTARSIGDGYWLALALDNIATEQVEAGDIAGALNTARSIEDGQMGQAWALGNIAKGSAGGGRHYRGAEHRPEHRRRG